MLTTTKKGVTRTFNEADLTDFIMILLLLILIDFRGVGKLFLKIGIRA